MGTSLDTWWADHLSAEAKRADAERAAWLTAHPTEDPAPLEFPMPDCTVCGLTTYHDSDSFRCDACGISWGSGYVEGAFDECEAQGPDVALILSAAFGAALVR